VYALLLPDPDMSFRKRISRPRDRASVWSMKIRQPNSFMPGHYGLANFLEDTVTNFIFAEPVDLL